MAKRIYSEEEVEKLIRRAVQLEAEKSSGSRSSGKGLTIQELEEIASETGINPKSIQQAADELETGPLTSDKPESTTVSRNEIVCEQWVDAIPSDQVIDDLITELNHRFGTSEDDGNWWDKLWDDYSGRAKVKRFSRSIDWSYTDEMEMYTTRVLMQKRGDKFRIRVSKRQGWNMSWHTGGGFSLLGGYLTVVFLLAGGIIGLTVFNNVLMGLLSGIGFSALAIPATNYYRRQKLDKYKNEVAEIGEALAFQARQMVRETGSKTKQKSSQTSDTKIIEIDDSDDEKSDDKTSGNDLRNMLRED